jgi:glycine dehydrogenase
MMSRLSRAASGPRALVSLRARGVSLRPADAFASRHLGPRDAELSEMLRTVGAYKSLDELANDAVPAGIRLAEPVALPEALTESEALAKLRAISKKNVLVKNMIGTGYYETVTPGVILRNILENPAWYTSYTPYQAEIAQGRLQSLLNFQTMVCDLTGMDISNASLLDEATAAAEALTMSLATNTSRNKFFVSDLVHPQTIDVVRTRAAGVGVEVVVGDVSKTSFDKGDFAGVLVQYPATNGALDAPGLAAVSEKCASSKTVVVVAADLLALTLAKEPGVRLARLLTP